MLITKHPELSFTLLLQIALLTIPFVLAIAMMLNDADRVISWRGFLLTSSIAVLLALLLQYVEKTAAFSLAATLSVYLLIFAFPRLIQLAAVPTSTSLVKNMHINELMCDNALTYLAFGTVAIALGLIVGDRVKGNPLVISPDFKFSHLILTFLLVSANAIYWQLGMGGTVLLTNPSLLAEEPLTAIMSQLFGQHEAMIFLLTSIILYKKPSWIIFVVLMTYAGVTVILGSRGAAVAILLMAASILAWRGSMEHYKVKISSVLAFFILLGVISALVFPFGTAVRNNYIDQRNAVDIDQRNAVEPAEFTAGYITQVSNRLGAGQDSQILIINVTPQKDLAEKYLNVTYSLKSAVNILLPGTIFEDAKINTAFMPRFIYEGADPRLLTRDYYESRPYTAWGFSFSHFGWYGGLIFLFLVSAALSLVYSFIVAQCKRAWVPILYLYSVALSFFGMSGLDALIVDTVKGLVHAFVLILFIKMISSVALKSRRAAEVK